jgi:DNA mismatch endonuclease (patch repair protein)
LWTAVSGTVARVVTAKVARNKRRDKTVNRVLRKKGWRVLRIWEHELKDTRKLAARLRSRLCLERRAAPP